MKTHVQRTESNTAQSPPRPRCWPARVLTPLLLAIAGGLVLVFLVRPLLAQEERLTILQTASNQFQIKITNAVANTNYLIERTDTMKASADWRWHVAGTNGQTNFTVL